MGGKHTGANYDLAKAEADKVDAQIIETLKTGHSFRAKQVRVLAKLTL